MSALSDRGRQPRDQEYRTQEWFSSCHNPPLSRILAVRCFLCIPRFKGAHYQKPALEGLCARTGRAAGPSDAARINARAARPTPDVNSVRNRGVRIIRLSVGLLPGRAPGRGRPVDWCSAAWRPDRGHDQTAALPAGTEVPRAGTRGSSRDRDDGVWFQPMRPKPQGSDQFHFTPDSLHFPTCDWCSTLNDVGSTTHHFEIFTY